MILAEIKAYLVARGQASLRDIALHCDADPSAVQGMLEQWVSKGKVVRQTLTASCDSRCNQCDQGITDIYIWQGSGQKQASPQTEIVAPPCLR